MFKFLSLIVFLTTSCASTSVKTENEIAEVNYPLFNKEAEVLSVRFADSNDLTCESKKKCLILSLNQGLNHDDQSKINVFWTNVTKEFQLISKNGSKLKAEFYGYTNANNKVRGNQLGFSLILSEETTKGLVSGNEYKVVYLGELKQKDNSWKFPAKLSVIAP